MKTLTEQDSNTLRKIKTAYETNNTDVIAKVNSIFGEPNPLTGVLLEKYNELGETPIEEPKLFALLTEGSGVFAFANELASISNIKISDFDTLEYASFIAMCKKKITNFTSDDGGFKSTPLTENAKLPSIADVEKIGEMSIKLNEARINVINDESEDNIKAFEKVEKDFDTLVFKVSGVAKKGLSDWEKQLLRENITASATNIMNTILGRSL